MGLKMKILLHIVEQSRSHLPQTVRITVKNPYDVGVVDNVVFKAVSVYANAVGLLIQVLFETALFMKDSCVDVTDVFPSSVIFPNFNAVF